MNDSWQLNNSYSPREVAALVLGIEPHLAIDGQLEPLLKRMRTDFNSAIYAHRDAINTNDHDPADVQKLLETSLQSNKMLYLTGESTPDYQYNQYYVYEWLSAQGPSTFDQQEFHRDEVAKWLKANDIKSVFVFRPVDKPEPLDIADKKPIRSHDSLPTAAIALLFKLDSDKYNNSQKWKELAKNCKRHGLEHARTSIGKGKAPSKFDPVMVGAWLVKEGFMEESRVIRLLYPDN